MKPSSYSSPLKMIGALGVVLLVIVAILGRPGTRDAQRPGERRQTETTAPRPASHYWMEDSQRTIVVAEPGEVLPRKQDILTTTLVEGVLPAGANEARVLTDSQCAPDAQGISHCLNRLAVGGTEITVQHHHKMRTTPCLSPGETVHIADAAAYRAL